MRRTSALRLSLCALVCALAPSAFSAFAQEYSPPPTGRIHGRVISPTGQPQNGGTVSLSTDGGETLTYSFPVSANGEYAGEASIGEYTLLYRATDTPEGKVVDYIQAVIILAGKDVAQDDRYDTPGVHGSAVAGTAKANRRRCARHSAAAAAASNLANDVNARPPGRES